MIDTTTNTVATVTMGSSPRKVAVTPDGKHVYVTSFLSNTVSVIDTASNTVAGTPIPVGNCPHEVAITPDGKHAYVANGCDNTVSVIDTGSNTVEPAVIMVGMLPLGWQSCRRRRASRS